MKEKRFYCLVETIICKARGDIMYIECVISAIENKALIPAISEFRQVKANKSLKPLAYTFPI